MTKKIINKKDDFFKISMIIIISVLITLIICICIYISNHGDNSKTSDKLDDHEVYIESLDILNDMIDGDIESKLDNIYSLLDRQDLDQAAVAMHDFDLGILQDIYKQAIEDIGTYPIYDGENFIHTDIEQGLLIIDDEEMFYGDFIYGIPQGDVLAINAYDKEMGRYDYSIGIWDDGKMEGSGTSGYKILDENSISDDDSKAIIKIEKNGIFRSDIMDGNITYIISYDDDSVNTYKFDISDGKIVIDDSWTYDELEDIYEHSSIENEIDVYALPASDIDKVNWKNYVQYIR